MYRPSSRRSRRAVAVAMAICSRNGSTMAKRGTMYCLRRFAAVQFVDGGFVHGMPHVDLQNFGMAGVLPMCRRLTRRHAHAARSDERLLPAGAFHLAHHFGGAAQVVNERWMLNGGFFRIERAFLKNGRVERAPAEFLGMRHHAIHVAAGAAVGLADAKNRAFGKHHTTGTSVTPMRWEPRQAYFTARWGRAQAIAGYENREEMPYRPMIYLRAADGNGRRGTVGVSRRRIRNARRGRRRGCDRRPGGRPPRGRQNAPPRRRSQARRAYR